MSNEVNNNDESSDEEVDENEDIPESDTERDPIVFESDDEEDELSFETDSDDSLVDEDYSENDSISLDESSNEDADEILEKEKKNIKVLTSKDKTSTKVKKNESSISTIGNKNVSNKLQSHKHSKPITNKTNKSDESVISKVTQKSKVQNKKGLKTNNVEKVKENVDIKENTKTNTINENVNSDKLATNQQINEYEYDSSDEEDIRNTVGNIPMKWYDEYDHIGYNWDGKKIIKPQKGDQLDNFLKRMEDPDFWRTIKDPQTGQDVVLSEADIDLITRIQKRKIPDVTFDEYSVCIFSITLI